MNAFEKLLCAGDEDKRQLGIEYTPAEINQQPEMWTKTVGMLLDRKHEIVEFLLKAGLANSQDAALIVTGAGSSEFIGTAVTSLLRKRLQLEVSSIPTTHLVTHTKATLSPSRNYTVISFARSGNSPESKATHKQIKEHLPNSYQIVITCNPEGALARVASEDPNALTIILPEETNDQSLVMTSSFSSMALAASALAYMEDAEELQSICSLLCAGARRIIREYGDELKEFANIPFSRACFLGSDCLFGTMQECQLKMLEMTEGRVATRFESFLGLRHGPQVFVDENCVVVAGLSSDPLVRRYEEDMLRELREKGQGAGVLVICDRKTEELERLASHVIELFPEEGPVPDQFRVMTDVVVGQILATFKSMALGYKPDNPSSSGVINRVVQGVVIYDD